MTSVDERHPVIRPRRVTFDWTDVPLHWLGGNAFATHMMNSLQLMLPAGERWFVHVYKQTLPLIDDERLHAETKGFMGQEAVHARAHAPVYEHLKAHGLNAQEVSDKVEFVFTKMLGDTPPVPLRWISKKRWLLIRVGIIAGIEHYTAVMGRWILNADALDRAGVNPVMLDLFRWHGAEEVEHRSVAFDVYQYVSGNYLRRVLCMLGAFLGLCFALDQGVTYLLKNDPELAERSRRENAKVKVGRRYRYWRRAARDGTLPSPYALAREMPTYLKRDFHPSEHGSTKQATDYLATSPAAKAAGYGD
jgi:uncharacterized protein